MNKRVNTLSLKPGEILILYKGHSGKVYFDENLIFHEDKVFCYVISYPFFDNTNSDYKIRTSAGKLSCYEEYVNILNV